MGRVKAIGSAIIVTSVRYSVVDGGPSCITAIPVYASTASNNLVFLGEVLADGRETTFHLTGPANMRKIVLDPRQTILTTPK
jgi:hypothetical protein